MTSSAFVGSPARMHMEQADCAGKEGYPTPQAAASVARHRQKRGQTALRVYKCCHCGQFHMGHTRRKRT